MPKKRSRATASWNATAGISWSSTRESSVTRFQGEVSLDEISDSGCAGHVELTRAGQHRTGLGPRPLPRCAAAPGNPGQPPFHRHQPGQRQRQPQGHLVQRERHLGCGQR